MEYKTLPSRFRTCRPWQSDSNLTIIFKRNDVLPPNVPNDSKSEHANGSKSEHAQYTDHHSFLFSTYNERTSTAEFMNLISKGIARFDNMFLFHDFTKLVEKQDKYETEMVTNSVYSSYNLVEKYVIGTGTKDFEKRINKILVFIESALTFIRGIEEVSTICNFFILIIRALYILIVFIVKKKLLDKVNKIFIGLVGFTEKISTLFRDHENLESNVEFLTLRLYQCIAMIQCKYLTKLLSSEKYSFLKQFKEFKLLYKTLLIENCKQKLPPHILTNDDEEVPHLDILYDYICALLEKDGEIKHIEFSLLLEHREIKPDSSYSIFVSDFYTTIYTKVKEKFEKWYYDDKQQSTNSDKNISGIIFYLLVDFYYSVYKGTFLGLSEPDIKINIIFQSATDYANKDNANNVIPSLLKTLAPAEAFDKLFGTSNFYNQKIYESNYKPFLKLQIDLVRILKNNKNVKIGPELLERFKIYDNEDNLKASKIKIIKKKDNSTYYIDYTLFSGKRITKFDTLSYSSYEYKFISLEKDKVNNQDIDEGKVYSIGESKAPAVDDDKELKKLYYYVNILKELNFFSPFENIFSVEDLGNQQDSQYYFLKNTELVIIVNKQKKVELEYKDEVWTIEDVPLFTTSTGSRFEEVPTYQNAENTFLLKLCSTKDKSKIKYLFISAPIQNEDNISILRDPFYSKYDISIPHTLTWKHKFLRSRDRTYLLPGRKTGSIICNEPSELISNPYLFHQYTKYSILHFFNKEYSGYLSKLNKEETTINNHPHLGLWYLYMNTIGIQYKDCWDDLKDSMKIISQQKEESECFTTFRYNFLEYEFTKNVFDDIFESKDINIKSIVPTIFNTVLINDLNARFGKASHSDSERWQIIIETIQKLSGNIPDQHRVEKQLKTMVNILNNNINGEKRYVYELPMGFGKTSSLIPCIVYTCSKNKFKRGVLVVPYHLVSVVSSQLTVFDLYFPNHVQMESSLQNLSISNRNDNLFHISVCSDYDYKSFIVDNPGNKDAFDIVVVDEVDSLFDNIKTDFFKSNSLKRVVDIFDKVETLSKIYTDLKEKYGFNDELKCLSLPGQEEVDQVIRLSGKYEEYINTAWFSNFINVLYTVNSMRYNLHYGLAKDNKRLFAVPYLNANTPSPTNQFSNPDMVFVLTYLSYLYCDESDMEYTVNEYNLMKNTKDLFGRSKLSFGVEGKVEKGTERDLVLKRLVMFVFESNFEYSSEMNYTSMIDATCSFYAKKLIGFSGTLTLINPMDNSEQPLFVEYVDMNGKKQQQVKSIPYMYEEFENCKIEKNIYNKQLCFLDEIKILGSPVIPHDIIFLDIGDVYLYEKRSDVIKSDIIKKCSNRIDATYEFYSFKNGKINNSKKSKGTASSCIYFYDHMNCRGTDYTFPKGDYSIVISISLRKSNNALKTDNSFSEFLQALYRVRQLNKYFENQTETFKALQEKNNKVNGIYIYFIEKTQRRPTSAREVVNLLMANEYESFEERKAYAKQQYEHYLKHHFESNAKKNIKAFFNNKGVKNVLSSQTDYEKKKKVESYVLSLKDVNVKAESQSNSENKNQLQNKNNLEIPKNGDIRAFDINFKLSEPSPVPELYTLSDYHIFNYGKTTINTKVISIKSSTSIINLSTQDLIYACSISGNKINIYILPFVLIDNFYNYCKIYAPKNENDSYTAQTMFGDTIFSMNSKSNCSSIIRLFNNLVPYDINLNMLNIYRQDMYLFDRLAEIDYLYPFNMIYYENESVEERRFSDKDFSPLKRLSYRDSFKDELKLSYDDKKYSKYQYLTSTKTSGTSFLPTKNKSGPYYDAFINFTKSKMKFDTFYDNFLKFKASYDSRMCIAQADGKQINSCTSTSLLNKQKCLQEKLNGNNESIITYRRISKNFKEFCTIKWNEVINSESKNFSIDQFRRALLVHLLSMFKSDDDENRMDCSEISIIRTTSTVEINFENLAKLSVPEKEKQYLKSLADHIQKINEDIFSDSQKLPSEESLIDQIKKVNLSDSQKLPSEGSPLADQVNNLIAPLRNMKKLNTMNDKIVRYLYQYNIALIFQNYYDKAIKVLTVIEHIDELFSTSQLLFCEFEFTHYSMNGKCINMDSLGKFKIFLNYFKEKTVVSESQLSYLENDRISPDARNLILEKLISERWKLMCEEVINLYNDLPRTTPNTYEFKSKLTTLNSYFKDLNSKLYNAPFIGDSKESDHNDYPNLHYTDALKTKVDSETNYFKQQYPEIWEYLKSNSNDKTTKEFLYVLLSFDIPVKGSQSSKGTQSTSSGTSDDKSNNPLSFTSKISPSGAKQLAAAAVIPLGLLALHKANRKYNLTQKARDFFYNRWSKKKEVPVVIEGKKATTFYPPKKNTRSSLKSALSVRQSVEKNSRKKHVRR